MSTFNYYRTARGLDELHKRTIKMSSRIRTLLVLIESQDLSQLNDEMKHKLVTADHINFLLDHQLISTQPTAHQYTDTTDIKNQHYIGTHSDDHIVANPYSPHDHWYKDYQQSAVSQPIKPDQTAHPPLAACPHDEEVVHTSSSLIQSKVKQLMVEGLEQYTGIMTRQLVQSINAAHDLNQLRTYQRSWLTAMFETKICKQQLQQTLHQINELLQSNPN